jgi:phosphate-selective porin OprO and OprP
VNFRTVMRLLGAAVALLLPTLRLQAQQASDAERLERLERAVQMLQQRNAELEREVGELKREKRTSSAASPAPQQAAPVASADAKAAVEQQPAKEEKPQVYALAAGSETKLTLGGYVQAQAEGGDVFAFEGRFSNGAGEIDDRFRLRRARLYVSGEFAEDFDFKLEGDFGRTDTAVTVRDPVTGATLASNATRTSFGATDLFVNWHRVPELNVKVGQFKAPFGLEQLASSTRLVTAERTLVTTSLTPERQIGVQIWGKPFANISPDQKDLLTYYAGIFNGNGRNINVNDNSEFMYVGRLEVQALRSKILNEEELTVKFGANGLSSRDDAGTTVSSLLRENSDGSLSSFALPSAAKREAYGLDVALRVGSFDFAAEYLNMHIQPRTVAGVAPRFTALQPDGYYLQGSYFVIPKKLQFVSKFESFDPDQAADDDIHSITAGVNYLIKGDDIKVAANYIHTWSDFREARPQFGRDEFDEVIVRLQVMF